MKTYELLEASANYIDRNGWAQGCIQDEDGRVCAMGAMLKSNCDGASSFACFAAVDAMSDWLCPQRPRGLPNNYVVASWNDRPTRTKEEVTAALRACAALLRAQEARDAPVTTNEGEVCNVA